VDSNELLLIFAYFLMIPLNLNAKDRGFLLPRGFTYFLEAVYLPIVPPHAYEAGYSRQNGKIERFLSGPKTAAIREETGEITQNWSIQKVVS
jgi:hypothetical protein